MGKTVIAFVASSLIALGTAAADGRVHASTDIVTWDKPVTEAQCLEKGQKLITGLVKGVNLVSANHAVVGTMGNWILSVDCLQSYKLNGAYVLVIYTGDKTDEYGKLKESLSRGLGGKSELYK